MVHVFLGDFSTCGLKASDQTRKRAIYPRRLADVDNGSPLAGTNSAGDGRNAAGVAFVVLPSCPALWLLACLGSGLKRCARR